MIDWDRVTALRDEVGPEDFDEVVEIFLQEVDEEIETLATAEPPTELSEKLHFLKGSALNLGFRQFSSLCQSGEATLAAGSEPVDIDALMTSYQTSRTTFLAELEQKMAG